MVSSSARSEGLMMWFAVAEAVFNYKRVTLLSIHIQANGSRLLPLFKSFSSPIEWAPHRFDVLWCLLGLWCWLSVGVTRSWDYQLGRAGNISLNLLQRMMVVSLCMTMAMLLTSTSWNEPNHWNLEHGLSFSRLRVVRLNRIIAWSHLALTGICRWYLLNIEDSNRVFKGGLHGEGGVTQSERKRSPHLVRNEVRLQR